MNKREFMDALRSGLSFLSPKEQGDVIAEFEEHFEVGVERGHTEQQLVDQLGDPRRIVEAYRSEAIEKGGLRVEVPAPTPPRVEPATAPEPPPCREERDEPGPSGGFSRFVSIHERYTVQEVREITIDSADCDIAFELTDGNEIRVDIEGMSGCDMSARLSGGKLAITQEFRLLRLLNWRKEPDIRVAMPRAFGGKMRIATASGDIKLPGFKGESLALKSVSGDWKLGDLYAQDRILLSTTSGDIRAGKCMAEAVDVHTTSGDIRFGALTTLDLRITSVSGDIDQAKSAIWEAKQLYIKTVSGDIKLALNDHWKAMEFISVSGDIHLTLPADSGRFEVRLDSVSGKVKSQLGSDSGAGRTIRAKTVSGDLKIERG